MSRLSKSRSSLPVARWLVAAMLATYAAPAWAGSGVTMPTDVPGKQFSDNDDRDALGFGDSEQEVLWDGLGNTSDGFDYSGSRGTSVGDGQVDALAFSDDAYFDGVRGNNFALLFSTTSDSNVYFERPDGSFGVWASAADIDGTSPVNDVDGLEIWGPADSSDADRYSLEGDPGLPGGPRVAVWAYDSTSSMSTAHILTSAIGTAIGLPDELWPQLDVDAMMTSPNADTRPSLLFSIAPIADPTGAGTLFDGGEIWYWDGTNAPASFLVHGGHTWDTAFDVKGTFGLASENINALEAVTLPEPGTLLLMAAGLAVAAFRERRMRRAQ